MKKTLLFLILFSIHSFYSEGQTLDTTRWVTNGNVKVITSNSSTGKIYLGGDFTYVGPNTGCAASINSQTASPAIDFPRFYGTVEAIIPDDNGGWYIGGNFTSSKSSVNNLAHILSNNTLDITWHPNATGTIYSLAKSGNILYVGGIFTTIGGASRNNLAAISTTTGTATSWNPNTGGTTPNGTVRAISVSGNLVYIGGEFSTVGGISRQRIAAVDATTGAPTSWNPSGNSSVNSIVVSGNNVYVGGGFGIVGGQSRNRIACLDVATGMANSFNPSANSVVLSLLLKDGILYTSGYFSSVGGQLRNGLAAIDTSSALATAWNPNLGSSAIGSTIFISGDTLYAGGTFNSVGSSVRNNIAAIDIHTGNAFNWDPDGYSGNVRSICVSGQKVIAGGAFTSMGGKKRVGIAELDSVNLRPTSWDLNLVPSTTVYTIIAEKNHIYVGGSLSGSIVPTSNGNLLRFDTSGNLLNWNAAIGTDVYTLLKKGNTIYVGGDFTVVNGQSRNYLAALDSATGNLLPWNPIINNRVFSLANYKNIIYAGGDLTTFNNLGNSHLVAMDAVSAIQYPLINVNNTVLSLAIQDTTLYASGYFTYFDNVASYGLGAINVKTNTSLPWKPNYTGSNVVFPFESDVYIGGAFSKSGFQVGLSIINPVTSLPNSTWAPKCTGATGVLAILVTKNRIYAGGGFTSVDGYKINKGFALFTKKQNQTISFSLLSNKTYGDVPFNISASSSSGLPVAFAIVSGPASISGSTITITGAGTVVVKAAQSGDANTNPATDVTQSFIVSKADQTITFNPIVDKISTDVPFSITASSSSGLTLSFVLVSGPASISGAMVTLDGTSGTVVIKAVQAGNATYNPAMDVTQSFTVSKADQTITFNPIADKNSTDPSFSISASSSSGLPVSFVLVSGPASISGAMVTLDGSSGTVVIKAVQTGNTTYNPATDVTQSFTVSKADQTITFDPIADKIITDVPFSISASSSSGLPISFVLVSGPASISGTTVTLNGTIGTVVIKAVQTGNTTYNSATDVTQSFTVSKADQTITFNPIADKNITDVPFSISASSSSGLPVTFVLVSGPASISGSTITLNGIIGTVIIKAVQTGDVNYNSAPEVQINFEVISATGIHLSAKNDNKVFIYPNPFNDKITIDINDNSLNEYPIEVIDTEGKKIMEIKPPFKFIDLTSLEPGEYFIQIKGNDSIYSKKIIKE